MKIIKELRDSKCYRVSVEDDGKEVAHGYLYLIKNDGHNEPYGLLERIVVDEDQRGKGIGSKLLDKIIKLAEENNCYKLIGTSRHSNKSVHKLYERIGFKNHGLEFRMDFGNYKTSI
jgi:GNAT superfamily N-acetyltransferase